MGVEDADCGRSREGVGRQRIGEHLDRDTGQRRIGVQVVVEADLERRRVHGLRCDQHRRSRVRLEELQKDQGGVRRPQLLSVDARLRLGEVGLEVAVHVEVGDDVVGPFGDSSEREYPFVTAEGRVGHGVALLRPRVDPGVLDGLQRDPVVQDTGQGVVGEVGSGREEELERLTEWVAEHVLDHGQHGDPIDDAFDEAPLHGDVDGATPVSDPDVAGPG